MAKVLSPTENGAAEQLGKAWKSDMEENARVETESPTEGGAAEQLGKVWVKEMRESATALAKTQREANETVTSTELSRQAKKEATQRAKAGNRTTKTSKTGTSKTGSRTSSKK